MYNARIQNENQRFITNNSFLAQGTIFTMFSEMQNIFVFIRKGQNRKSLISYKWIIFVTCTQTAVRYCAFQFCARKKTYKWQTNDCLSQSKSSKIWIHQTVHKCTEWGDIIHCTVTVRRKTGRDYQQLWYIFCKKLLRKIINYKFTMRSFIQKGIKRFNLSKGGIDIGPIVISAQPSHSQLVRFDWVQLCCGLWDACKCRQDVAESSVTWSIITWLII